MNNRGDSNKAFQKNVEDMIYHYGQEGGHVVGLQVAPSTAALHPDYENWYKLGEHELHSH